MHKIEKPGRNKYMSATSFRCAIGCKEIEGFILPCDGAYLRAVSAFILLNMVNIRCTGKVCVLLLNAIPPYDVILWRYGAFLYYTVIMVLFYIKKVLHYMNMMLHCVKLKVNYVKVVLYELKVMLFYMEMVLY